jgi:hypothetical protein
MATVTEFLLGLAALAVVVLVVLYASEHVTCWHLPYLANGCVVSK